MLNYFVGGVPKDDGEAWPYNGMAGFLVNWVGDLAVNILDQESSIAAGHDLEAYFKTYDVKKMNKEEKETFKSKWTTVILREKTSLWVPFGHVISIVPLSGQRDTKTEAPAAGASGSEKVKGKPGRKSDASEYSTTVFIPVLGDKDNEGAAKVVCSTVARFTANKVFGPDRWEKEHVWKSYVAKLQETVTSTSLKDDVSGAGDSGDQPVAT